MLYSKDKKMDELIRIAISRGARYVRGRKHGKLYLPEGQLLIISTTPSDRRAVLNLRANLRASSVGRGLGR